MTGAEKVLDLLGTLLTRRERQQAPTRTARVLGRHQDGTERLQRTDARCVTRGTPNNHYTGTVILNPSLAPFHQSGITGIGTSETIPAPTLWIEKLDPSEYHPGQTYQVAVHGRGFDEAVRIDFLDPDPTAPEGTLNPDLEILAIQFVSPELLQLHLAVAPTARPNHQRPHRLRKDLTSVDPPPPPQSRRLLGRAIHGRPALLRLPQPRGPRRLYLRQRRHLPSRPRRNPAFRRPPSAANGILIAADPNAAVGPGAIAWRSNDNEADRLGHRRGAALHLPGRYRRLLLAPRLPPGPAFLG